MVGPAAPAFSLRVGPHGRGALTVTRFSGTEQLSHLFDFQVDFHPITEHPLEAAELLGAEALLRIAVPGGALRLLHGRVRSVEVLGPREGRWRYRIRVAPALWWLTRVHRSRIFQGQTVPDILKVVLREAGVPVRLALGGGCGVREYCVQYRESDFDFLSRLMEWEGLFYFFEHSEAGHTLVIGDSPSVHEPLPGGGMLPLRAWDERSSGGEYLYLLERVSRLRPGAVHLQDFDFEKPALDVSGKAKSSEGVADLELYDYPGEYVAPAEGRRAAKVRMEEAVQESRLLDGESVAPSLTPGYHFEVRDGGSVEGAYSVVEVTHWGHLPETGGGREADGRLYRNRFRCLPRQVPFRPRRRTATPSIPGVQTATVVGPAGEEIHTDVHGRIKVQFHWDREGARDDKSSCWVRVGQSWGGMGWGAQVLPRIGQEVVVRFLEGNPDRPLIGGTVYNGENPTPYTLPDEKTKSTFKSASSLGSQGFNELRFEDVAGAEEVFVHAQKDEVLRTENDKAQQVLGYEDLSVKKERSRTVEGNQSLDVARDDASRVEGSQSLKVRGDRATRIQGSQTERVVQDQRITVSRNQAAAVALTVTESVEGAHTLDVGKDFTVDVATALEESVGGARSVSVRQDRLEYVEGARQEKVLKDSELRVGGAFQVEVKGEVTLTSAKDWKETVNGSTRFAIPKESSGSAKRFELKADTFSLIVNEKKIFVLEKSGAVQFFPKSITVEGSDVAVKGSKVKKLAAGSPPSAQVQALRLAAISGVPFCERCESAKKKESSS
ncbi:type VI secretion system tip protein VgrG [Myxococcus stipitatus]|uniref:type VI secretion system Vgr family protein n=1 Tax=Myxococcus stipitatus TaxID=83455 RepID=UPI00314516A2